MASYTLFMWGYWGWGGTTERLVEAVDVVERSRGFTPPFFVDVRIRRNVRAKGFNGNKFEVLVGQDRHRWMRELGNLWVQTHTGFSVQINKPEAAEELLDMVQALAKKKQRIIFFCWERFPGLEGQPNACHRVTIARLVLEYAARRNVPLEVVEWPGGTPEVVDIPVSAKHFKELSRNRKTIMLQEPFPLARYAGLAWGSTAKVHCGGDALTKVVGPANYQKSGWCLPVLATADPLRWRHENGFEPVVTKAPK